MAVVSLKTTAITAQDAADDKIATAGPYECVLTGTLETNADDSAGSVYRMVRVPANFVPTEILLATDALGGSAAANIGVYKIEEDGGDPILKVAFDKQREMFGGLLNPTKVMAHCPPILRAAGMLGQSIEQSGLLPKGLPALLYVRVATINGCPF